MQTLPAVATLLLFSLGLTAQIIIPTSQNNNARTGANLQEKILTPRNVNGRDFGRLLKLAVDGDVYAQPLFIPAVPIAGKGVHDLLFIATEHDSVYAFDAVSNSAAPVWAVHFTNPSKGITPVPAEAVGCPFIVPEVGITSTPVIDPALRTLYVLARTREVSSTGRVQFWQRLHALDLATGTEKLGGPVTIRASVQTKTGGLLGFGQGSVEFLSLHENPRAALLLSHGKLYLSWASSCDVTPYHGWMMAYDAHTLKQLGSINTSPETMESGIWQSDTGPAADEQGNVYVSTGNGVFNADSGGREYGDTLLKLHLDSSGLRVRDFFTPFDEANLSRTDADLGSGGPVLIPRGPASARELVVVAGKGGVIYLLDRDRLGKFHRGNNNNAVQTIALPNQVKSAPSYWNGHLYYVAINDVVRDFVLHGGQLQLACTSTAPIEDPGATPTVSANGASNGIVWLIESRYRADAPAILHAYAAMNVAQELYSSDANRARDSAGIARRFTIPTVANGRVYVGASREVDVYGLLPTPVPHRH